MDQTTPKRSDRADLIIVGGGLSGCALACALADGRRRIVILEARSGKNPRFNGELGLVKPLSVEGGAAIEGFACMRDAERPATLLPYREIPGSRPTGFAIDHRDLVEVLRRAALAKPGVDVELGQRVVGLHRNQERVTGVVTEDAHGVERLFEADLVLACDGRHSKVRALLELEERAKLLSFTAAVRLENCALPHPAASRLDPRFRQSRRRGARGQAGAGRPYAYDQN